jgi:LysM repeat protein
LKILVQSQQPAIKAKAPKSTSLTGETALENDSLKQIQLAQSSATPTNIAEKARYHTIKKGENLAGIAKKYGVTIQNLMTWNHMKNQNLIAGKKLRVNNPVVLAQDDNSVASAAIPGKNSNSDAADVKARYHVVARGEYIGKIAASYGITNEDLIAWNDLKSNSLQIGQKLRVNAPQPAVSEKTIAAKEPDSTGSNKRMEYYTVKAGDTLWSISQKYEGVTIDQLKEWNMITDNSLKVGQQIKVLLPGN